jgi:type VI secretion system secreted protein Hcp
MAVVDYFVIIDGIKGETQDAKLKPWGHRRAVVVLAASQSGTGASGGGSAWRVVMQDFHFTMPVTRPRPN